MYREEYKRLKLFSENYSKSVQNSIRRGPIEASVSKQMIDGLTSVGKIAICRLERGETSVTLKSIEEAIVLTAAKSRGTLNLNEIAIQKPRPGEMFCNVGSTADDYFKPLSTRLHAALESTIINAKHLTHGEQAVFAARLAGLTYENNIGRALEACSKIVGKGSGSIENRRKALNDMAQKVIIPLEQVRYHISYMSL